MIEGTIEEVFIKEVADTGIDMVMIVRNLPKKLIYREVPVEVTQYDRDGFTDGTQMHDPSGKVKEDLLEGLEHSQTYDKSILFRVSLEPGKLALEAIDRYISGTLPRDVVVPGRVPYPMVPGDPRSMPKPKELIPAIDLPVSEKPKTGLTDAEIIAKYRAGQTDIATGGVVSPIAGQPAVSATPRRTLSPEQKAKKAEILTKARAAKAAKKQA